MAFMFEYSQVYLSSNCGVQIQSPLSLVQSAPKIGGIAGHPSNWKA
jgi:hypothetical protein